LERCRLSREESHANATQLLGTIATGIAMRTQNLLAEAAQPATAVNFDVPADACDCHTHIFGDPQKFPFFAGRVYTRRRARRPRSRRRCIARCTSSASSS